VCLNLTGEEPADRIATAFGKRYRRLQAIKHAYDPANLFRANHNIPPRQPSIGSRTLSRVSARLPRPTQSRALDEFINDAAAAPETCEKRWSRRAADRKPAKPDCEPDRAADKKSRAPVGCTRASLMPTP